MKSPKLNLFILIFILTFNSLFGAYLENIPQTLTQPDGSILKCYASGDEFFNRLHDENGYTIIQNPETGFYEYAVLRNGGLRANGIKAGSINPATIGLKPDIILPPEQINQKIEEFNKIQKKHKDNNELAGALCQGTIQNLVVFISFDDDPEDFGIGFDEAEVLFNEPNGNSLYEYYYRMSYGTLEIATNFYPVPNGNTIVSYRAPQPRSYYQTYNRITNPNGYTANMRTSREQELIANAVSYVKGEIPSSINFDADNNGDVDNVTFIVQGEVEAWNNLLWPHKTALYYYNEQINGKSVFSYNLLLAKGDYFATRVIAHEMFHTLGAPDLYRYSHDGFTPVGPWDIMGSCPDPPSSMGAYMKYKYGGWISDIPVISQPGTYELYPVTEDHDVCYRINSPIADDEYFILEYRNNTGDIFDTQLPGSGLLVYRINSNSSGNSNGPPDEVYLYRPGETLMIPGTADSAYFSLESGRTEISNSTDPSPFLCDGSKGYLHIYDIGSAGESISFKVDFEFSFDPPDLISPADKSVDLDLDAAFNLLWSNSPDADQFNLQISEDDDFSKLVVNKTLPYNTLECNNSNLQKGMEYFWRARAISNNGTTDWSPARSFTTEPEHEGIFVWDGAGNKLEYDVSFIADFLECNGFKVHVSTELPNSLIGYDAVFLSFGSYSSLASRTYLYSSISDILTEYIKNGGIMYIEGLYCFTNDHYYYDTKVFDYYGLQQQTAWESYDIPVSKLEGQPGTIMSGISFNSSGQVNTSYILSLIPASGAIAAMIESDTLIAAVANKGQYNQTTYVSLYSLSALNDEEYPSTKSEYLYRIMEYFGLMSGDKYIMPDYSSDISSGHAPLEVNFIDASGTSGIEMANTYWNFHNDGDFNIQGSEVSHTFNDPGMYTVNMMLSDNDGNTTQRKFKDTIYVFDGESALEYIPDFGMYTAVPIDEDLEIQDAFTLEQWIYPNGTGTLDFNYSTSTKHGSLAAYRGTIQLYMPNQRHLRFEILNADFTAGAVETERYAIELEKWQHIAVTYDGHGDVKIYLNGEEQELRYFSGYEFTEGYQVYDDYNDFIIGNSFFCDEPQNWSFDGKIDEVRLWNKVRSKEEINATMNTLLHGDEEGLMGYWRFNDGNGTIVNDYSVNRNDGVTNCNWRPGISLEQPDAVIESNNDFSINRITVYPNPSDGTFKINYPGMADLDISISVYDCLGNIIYSGKQTINTTLKIKSINSGMYYLNLSNGAESITMPLLIVK